jgi:myo-inositol-1(or 4)-monophosphatase
MTGRSRPLIAKEFLVVLCRDAGREILEGFGGDLEISQKGDVDLVTNVDLALAERIRSAITRRYPDHIVVTEEGAEQGAVRQSGPIWLVDPLDGTTNYVHGYPGFGVSVALVHNFEVLIGCVYDPVRGEIFLGEKGRGATLNGQPIWVSKVNGLIGSLVSTGFPYERASLPENNVSYLGRVINRVQGVRRSGSLALDLAYVAAGRSDGHWELYVKPWDTAAGGLLVEEAGGRISTMSGAAWTPFAGDILATNGRIHDELLGALNQDRERVV